MKYIVAILISSLCLIACSAEEEYSCTYLSAQYEIDEEIKDSLYLVTVNALVDAETYYTFCQVNRIPHSAIPITIKISSYVLKIYNNNKELYRQTEECFLRSNLRETIGIRGECHS